MSGRLTRRARGFTITEMAISGALLALMLGMASVGTVRAITVRRASVTKTDLERQARAAVERILDLLNDSSFSTIVENLTTTSGSSSLTFRRSQGWSGGALTLGPTIAITLDADANDPTNGTDDDKDGVVDQKVLNISINSSAKIALARHVLPLLEGETANAADDNANGLVDEPGFVVSRSGSAVTVRLSLRRKGPDGDLQTVTVSGTTRVSP